MIVMNENIVFLNIINREGQHILKMNNIKIYIAIIIHWEEQRHKSKFVGFQFQERQF